MTIEPYNYNDEPSGRSETLVQALEKCERLEKQLKIAVEALEKYADKKQWQDEMAMPIIYCEDTGYGDAQTALQKIKELDNE